MKNDVPNIIAVDNAAQIFIPNFSREETTFSRIAINLKSQVDESLLSKALHTVIKRFPYYRVYLRNRFFGYVMEQTDDMPEVEKDTQWPCRYSDFLKPNFLFRVKTENKTIAVESSHILTDGHGTLVFLLTLIAEYFRHQDKPIENSIFIKDLDEEIPAEEWKCGFREKFSAKGPALKIPKPAFFPEVNGVSSEKYYCTKIVMNQSEVKTIARQYHVTMNVLLSAVYAHVLQNLYFLEKGAGKLKKDLPIRMEIPVNLRKDYPTECLKNFSYMYAPEFNPSEKRLSFEEIVHRIAEDIRHERHSGSISHQIARNLRVEHNIFFKFAPSIIKQLLFKISYHLLGRSLYSGIFTNFGEIRISDGLQSEIDSFDIMPANTPFPGRNSSAYSYKGVLEVNIGSTCSDLRFEEQFIGKLDELGIEHHVQYKRD